VKRNLAKERAGRPHATLRWLEPDRLAFFLAVGLGGLLPDGSEDSAFVGRNAARNRAFGELLAASGVRAQEGSYLLVHELPAADGPRDRLVALNVPGAIAKGGVPRRTIVSTAALRMIESYVRIERSAVGGGWSPAGALEVRDTTADGGCVEGRWARWGAVDVHARARLAENGAAITWPLSAVGGPMVDWSDVFARATERCRAFEPGFPRVTPHTLRHTFAVHTLRRLVSQTVRRVREHEEDPALDVLAGYWRIHDPLLALRDLLGHASVTTTQVYLHAVDPTRLLASVDEELEECQAA
jgi:integrase